MGHPTGDTFGIAAPGPGASVGAGLRLDKDDNDESTDMQARAEDNNYTASATANEARSRSRQDQRLAGPGAALDAATPLQAHDAVELLRGNIALMVSGIEVWVSESGTLQCRETSHSISNVDADVLFPDGRIGVPVLLTSKATSTPASASASVSEGSSHSDRADSCQPEQKVASDSVHVHVANVSATSLAATAELLSHYQPLGGILQLVALAGCLAWGLQVDSHDSPAGCRANHAVRWTLTECLLRCVGGRDVLHDSARRG